VSCYVFEESTDGVIYGDTQSKEEMPDLPTEYGEEGQGIYLPRLRYPAGGQQPYQA
jgi:hypothetical protein